jgi:endonuclease YncB( thermonuclease family)
LRHGSYYTTLPVLFLFLPQFTERILGKGDDENSISALILYNGLAKLSEDYHTCPNGDAFKLAEDLAKEQKLGIWANK